MAIKNKGVSIIEIIVAVAILAFVFNPFLGKAVFSLRTSNVQKQSLEAIFLARETIEAVRNFRDGTNWNTNGLSILIVDNPYHPEKSIGAGGQKQWSIITGEEAIGVFSRKIIFKNVLRDGAGNIVESAGAVDPDTKKAIITVSWQNKKIEIFSYFTAWR